MNELIPIGFLRPIQDKEITDAFAAIDKQVAALTELTVEQRKQVRLIARAHAKNNQGRLPDFHGLATHVKK
jgi:hypothetical protein